MSTNRYGYVSFSTPQLTPELTHLVDAATRWRPIRGRVVPAFDFAAWRAAARARFDVGPAPAVDRSDPAAVARAILDILVLDRYRRGPVEYVLGHREAFAQRIARLVAAGRPVEILIPSFPGRAINPLTHLRPQPDLGEVASFTRLWQMSEHVRTVYDPGLRFIISLDGRAYAPFYGYTREGFSPYPDDLRRIIAALHVGAVIDLVDLQSLVDERRDEFAAVHAEVADELAREWDRPDYAFRDDLVASMKLGANTSAVHAAAIKLVKFYDPDLDVEAAVQAMRRAVHERARATAFAYMCFLVTIRRLELLSRKFPEALRGTVHPKDGQYSPYLVAETTRIVPWHGVGVLRPDGRVDSVYESEILEQPDRYVAVYLEGEYTPFYYEDLG